MKSGTDSGGFDSPRSFHIGSLKTPGKKKKARVERGGGTKASVELPELVAAQLFEVQTEPFLPSLLYSPLSLVLERPILGHIR